jgi:hypothetical protein
MRTKLLGIEVTMTNFVKEILNLAKINDDCPDANNEIAKIFEIQSPITDEEIEALIDRMKNPAKEKWVNDPELECWDDDEDALYRDKSEFCYSKTAIL